MALAQKHPPIAGAALTWGFCPHSSLQLPLCGAQWQGAVDHDRGAASAGAVFCGGASAGTGLRHGWLGRGVLFAFSITKLVSSAEAAGGIWESAGTVASARPPAAWLKLALPLRLERPGYSWPCATWATAPSGRQPAFSDRCFQSGRPLRRFLGAPSKPNSSNRELSSFSCVWQCVKT